MYRTVYDLTREELEELTDAYFWGEESDEICEQFEHSYDIPDDIIFEHFKGIGFVDDDFFCNQEGEE